MIVSVVFSHSRSSCSLTNTIMNLLAFRFFNSSLSMAAAYVYVHIPQAKVECFQVTPVFADA